MKKKNRPNDVISIPHRSYVSLKGYTWSFRVNEKARAHSVMLISPIFNIFNNRQSTRNTFIPNLTTTLPGTRSSSTKPMFAPSVPHGQFCTRKRFFFPLVIDWCVQYTITKFEMHWLNMSHNNIFHMVANGGLPISRVAPLDQLLPLSLGSSGWFSQYMSYEDSKDFLSNNCSIRTRYLNLNTIFPKSTVIQ